MKERDTLPRPDRPATRPRPAAPPPDRCALRDPGWRPGPGVRAAGGAERGGIWAGGVRAAHARPGRRGGDREAGVARPRVRAPTSGGARVAAGPPGPPAGRGRRVVPRPVGGVAGRHGVPGRARLAARVQPRLLRRHPARGAHPGAPRHADGLRPRAVLLLLALQERHTPGTAEQQVARFTGQLSMRDVELIAPCAADPAGMRLAHLAARRNPWAAYLPAAVSDLSPGCQSASARSRHASWERMDAHGFSPQAAQWTSADHRRLLLERAETHRAAIDDISAGADSDRAVRDLVSWGRAEGIAVAVAWAPESPTYRAMYTPRAGRRRRLRPHPDPRSGRPGVPVADPPRRRRLPRRLPPAPRRRRHVQPLARRPAPQAVAGRRSMKNGDAPSFAGPVMTRILVRLRLRLSPAPARRPGAGRPRGGRRGTRWHLGWRRSGCSRSAWPPRRRP